jgi:hypothetical protein
MGSALIMWSEFIHINSTYFVIFWKPLWVPSSLIKSPEHKCSADWDAALYRGGVVMDGDCGGQQGSGESCSQNKQDLLEVG